MAYVLLSGSPWVSVVVVVPADVVPGVVVVGEVVVIGGAVVIGEVVVVAGAVVVAGVVVVGVVMVEGVLDVSIDDGLDPSAAELPLPVVAGSGVEQAAREIASSIRPPGKLLGFLNCLIPFLKNF